MHAFRRIQYLALALFASASAGCGLHTQGSVENETLSVYGPISGLAPSEHYSFRIRQVGSSEWLSPFAFITRCLPSTPENDATAYYSKYMGSWSNSYINFEMAESAEVEIEISKVDSSPILTAAALPAQAVQSCSVQAGKVYVRIIKTGLFTVDIDGQMDQTTARLQPSGWNRQSHYSGPPIHTLTIFANPVLTDKPDPADPSVLVVQPGDRLPQHDGPWTTLYFAPGVHDIGRGFKVHKDRNYYIPGDAIVYGSFNNRKDFSDGANIRIFGHGTLSGERINHPRDESLPVPEEDRWQYNPIDIAGPAKTYIEGITIADSAHHSLMLYAGYNPELPVDVSWVKIFTWRGNGDGINPFGNLLVEDSFIRAADDSFYVNGRGIRRCVIWNDVNGSAFLMTAISGIQNPDLVIEDCDVLYNRSIFTENSRGGHVFAIRGEGRGAGGSNVTFRNIRVHDPYATQPPIALETGAPYFKDPNYDYVRGPGDISGIRFEDITIESQSILGYPNTLWGTSDARIRSLIFEKVSIAGEFLDSIDDFTRNSFVSEIDFLLPDLDTRFVNQSGDNSRESRSN